jgi:hypothetical protein
MARIRPAWWSKTTKSTPLNPFGSIIHFKSTLPENFPLAFFVDTDNNKKRPVYGNVPLPGLSIPWHPP